MTPTTYHLISRKVAQNAIQAVSGLSTDGSWDVVIKKHTKDRSLSQNRLAFRFYRLLGKATGNGAEYERNFAKYTFGCPILLADDEDGSFTEFYETLINSLEYEKLIDAMRFIEVTRLFSVSQFRDYLEAIEKHAYENHYALIEKDDDYYQAMGI